MVVTRKALVERVWRPKILFFSTGQSTDCSQALRRFARVFHRVIHRAI